MPVKVSISGDILWTSPNLLAKPRFTSVTQKALTPAGITGLRVCYSHALGHAEFGAAAARVRGKLGFAGAGRLSREVR
jgi:hypothetical protein